MVVVITSTVKSVAIEVAAIAVAFAFTGIALTVQIPLIDVRGVATATAWVVLAATPLCALRAMRAERRAGSKRSGGAAPETSNLAGRANPRMTLSIHAHALGAGELAASKTVRSR